MKSRTAGAVLIGVLMFLPACQESIAGRASAGPVPAPSEPGAASDSPTPTQTPTPTPTPAPTVPTEEPAEYPVRENVTLSESPTWQRANSRGVLRIGTRVRPVPLLSEPFEGQPGFETRIGLLVAAHLGFGPERVEFVPASVLDYSQPDYPWNDEHDLFVGGIGGDGFEDLMTLSRPYYLGGESVAVTRETADGAGESLTPEAALAGKVVGAMDYLVQEGAVDPFDAADVVPLTEPEVARVALSVGEIDAWFHGDAELRALAATRYDEIAVLGPPLVEVPTSVAMPPGEDALRAAVDEAIGAYIESGDWQLAYDITLGRSGLPAQPPK